MGIIRPFLLNRSFGPEDIQAMSDAFDRAAPFMDHTPEANEILAMQIMSVASTGERDPDKLAAAALASFCAVRRTG